MVKAAVYPAFIYGVKCLWIYALIGQEVVKKEMKFEQDADTRPVSVTVTKGEHESSFVCDITESTVVLSHLTTATDNVLLYWVMYLQEKAKKEFST